MDEQGMISTTYVSEKFAEFAEQCNSSFHAIPRRLPLSAYYRASFVISKRNSKTADLQSPNYVTKLTLPFAILNFK